MEEHQRAREQPWSGREESPGPADEYEALRARLLADLRRQPGDTRALTRIASSLSRMQAARGRGSRGRRELAANMELVLSNFGDLILPAD